MRTSRLLATADINEAIAKTRANGEIGYPVT